MNNAEVRQLLTKIAAGCDASLAELYDQFAVRLYRLALAITGRPTDAEDAVAEVFLVMTRRPASLAAVEQPAAYLATSVRNVVGRQIAKREKDRTATEQLFTRQTEATLQTPTDERSEQLRQALGRLPESQREIVALKIYAELTFAEIAETLDISANTAASRYRYALEKLRDLLAGEET